MLEMSSEIRKDNHFADADNFPNSARRLAHFGDLFHHIFTCRKCAMWCIICIFTACSCLFAVGLTCCGAEDGWHEGAAAAAAHTHKHPHTQEPHKTHSGSDAKLAAPNWMYYSCIGLNGGCLGRNALRSHDGTWYACMWLHCTVLCTICNSTWYMQW